MPEAGCREDLLTAIMTTTSKILLMVSVAGLVGGSFIDFHGVNANPSLAAVLPLGAIAFGLFLIIFTMEKEVAKYDEEQEKTMQRIQSDAAAFISERPAQSGTTERPSIQPAGTTVDTHAHARTSAAPDDEAVFNLKNVLVPIDFSDGSRKALEYAIRFAKQFKGRLILAHVVTRHSGTLEEFDKAGEEPRLSKELENESMQKLKVWVQEFVPGEIPTVIRTCYGVEAIEIVNEAKKSAADLMVISTHGRTGRAHALAGSLAENIVQLAPCPVLVVREHEHDFIETTLEHSPKKESGRASANSTQTVKQTSPLATPIL